MPAFGSQTTAVTRVSADRERHRCRSHDQNGGRGGEHGDAGGDAPHELIAPGPDGARSGGTASLVANRQASESSLTQGNAWSISASPAYSEADDARNPAMSMMKPAAIHRSSWEKRKAWATPQPDHGCDHLWPLVA